VEREVTEILGGRPAGWEYLFFRYDTKTGYCTISKFGTISGMRTSINLDPEVHDFTSAYANAKGMTLSAAINELIRRAEKAPEPVNHTSGRLKRNEHGYLVIARTGNVVTPEMVKELSEDKIV
jgi:hypothetical protein